MTRLILLLTASLTLIACSNSTSFTSVLDLQNRTWNADEWVEFDFRQTDTINPHRIGLMIRHSPDFEWQALKLEIRTINPAQRYWCDTIIVPLADDSERWLGKEHTTHVDLNSDYRTAVKFTQSGHYNIRIRRLSPKQAEIEGIKAIGLTIDKNGKK